MPYRDAETADAFLRARRTDLARDLVDVEARIAERRRRAPLPLLATVVVASPCDARWEEMRGDDQARRCTRCDRTVFDLSAHDAADAEALLREHAAAKAARTGDEPCLRLFRRADGTVLTRDCPVGARRAVVSKAVRRLGKLGALGALTLVPIAGVAAMAALPVLGGAGHTPRRARSDAMAVRASAEMLLAEDARADCPTVGDLVRAGLLDRAARTRDPWGHEFEIHCDGGEVRVSSVGLKERHADELPAARVRLERVGDGSPAHAARGACPAPASRPASPRGTP